MSPAALADLAAFPDTIVRRNVPLAEYTRFAIGGPAQLLAEISTAEAFRAILKLVQRQEWPHLVIGGGTNLVVADSGFDGIVLQFRADRVERSDNLVRAQAGCTLQCVVDFSIAQGLEGMQTLTGIPGFLGGAVYGNAGAYGHSMQEIVERVHATDGSCVRVFSNVDCGFHYRESLFKAQKQWTILAADLRLIPGDSRALRKAADDIRTIRDEKYPPDMRCAGSIFKNLLLTQLPALTQEQVPPRLVRDGKVPAAWFLEQVQLKGLRIGDIHVATYHANLIYNDGHGTATDLVAVISECKRRVRDRFGFDLEEEVQYVGFAGR